MNKTDVVRQYRTKYPEWPNKKLSRVIYNNEGALFNNSEQVRIILMRIEGKSKSGQDTIVTHKRDARPYNPYKLPPSDETSYEPYVLNHKRILGLFDIHAPYHSITALTAALNFAKKEKPDAVLIGGDLFDFHGLSKYIKDPRKKNFAEELAVGVSLLESVQKALKCPIYYKLGNHCERYQHYLWMKLGELNGVEEFELGNIIKKRISGVEIIGEKRIVKAGDLNVVHGHEFASSIISPVNIARGLYLRAKSNTLCGHHHRSSEHTEQDINGKIVTTWSVGCLSELHPQYMPINSWNHGMCLIDVSGNDFEVRNKRIWHGKIL